MPSNILLVTPNAPWPPHTGSSQRTALLYEALSQIGTVKTICLQNPDNLEPKAKEMLEREFRLVAVARRWGDLAREPWKTLSRFNQPMAARLGNFFGASKSRFAPDKRLIQSLDMPAILKDVDLIVGRYTTTLTALDLLNRSIPCLIDVDDLDSAALHSQAIDPNITTYSRWIAKRHLKNVMLSEASTLRKADGLWIANPDDIKQRGLQNAHYLPNIPFFQVDLNDVDTPKPSTRPVVGVIASFKHQPNIEAVDWFLNNVWGNVLLLSPDAVLKIYGSQIENTLKQRWSAKPKVDVVGFVEDVSTAYSEMSFSICPVQRGAGTNIKVLESAQFKRLCILTTSASRGLTEMKDALVICKDAAHMSEKVAFYLNNPEATLIAAQKLHESVERHYSRNAFNTSVHALVEEVLPKD